MAAHPHDDPTIIPMKPEAAKRLAREIVESGTVVFSRHAQEEMEKDDLQSADCLNLLRAGDFEPPELENNELRYRVSTRRMCVVIVFRSNERLRVVTAWRNR